MKLVVNRLQSMGSLPIPRKHGSENQEGRSGKVIEDSAQFSTRDCLSCKALPPSSNKTACDQQIHTVDVLHVVSTQHFSSVITNIAQTDLGPTVDWSGIGPHWNPVR